MTVLTVKRPWSTQPRDPSLGFKSCYHVECKQDANLICDYDNLAIVINTNKEGMWYRCLHSKTQVHVITAFPQLGVVFPGPRDINSNRFLRTICNQPWLLSIIIQVVTFSIHYYRVITAGFIMCLLHFFNHTGSAHLC